MIERAHQRGLRTLVGVALGALLLGAAPPVAAAGLPAAGPSPSSSVHLRDAAGIHVVGSQWVDARLLDVTVSTAALAAPVHVDVLVPDGYTTHRASRYPSLYLLHGCAAGRPSNGREYQEWTAGLDAEHITATTGAIVVMPEGGGGGFYTDWVNGGNGGPPMWETFHVGQLVPWIDANFRTIPERGERAIAGLSMGGFGALSYAARHPDLFGSTASFSGAADLTDPVDQAEPTSSVVVAACAAADGGGPDSTFGSHLTDELNWRAHDPDRIAGNLSDTAIYLYTGNGQPGPLDPPGTGIDAIEVLAGQATVQFHTRLEALGIPSFFDDYGAGTHSGAYWERDLRDVLPRFTADFAAHRRVGSFTYQTADPTYSIWDTQVAMHRLAGELSVLTSTGAAGFTLAGSGSASVVTAPLYRPRARCVVDVSGELGASTHRLRADQRGRLRVEVPLGPANPYQEYTAAADAAGTRVFTTRVSVQPGCPTARR
jgi:S-formylglutathione hydrolase FrmB